MAISKPYPALSLILAREQLKKVRQKLCQRRVGGGAEATP